MTKVVVEAGVCGFTTTVEAVSLPAHKIGITITSDCDKVIKMAELLKEVDWTDLWRQKGNIDSVHQAALQCAAHITCPVPVAILKAIEVEAGLALPRDVTIQFKTTNE